MTSRTRKRPYPRPIGKVEEDGSYATVGGHVRDAETKRMRRPHGIVADLMAGKRKRKR